MKKTTFKTKKKSWLSFKVALGLCVLTVTTTDAQIQNNETLYVGDQGIVYLGSGSYNFGAIVGQSITSRTPLNYGKIIFASAVTISGVSNTHYLDGYASVLSVSSFLLPVGQAGEYAPARITPATVAPIDASYYRASPSVISSVLDASVPAISGIEYWNIQGNNSASVSLTYRASSNLSAIASSTIELFIVGYDGTKWVKIPSIVDAVSILGGASTLSSGSITSSSDINLTNFKYFSIGADVTLNNPEFTPTVFTAYILDQQLNIKCNQNITGLEVFDITGKKIFESRVENTNEYLAPFYYAQGVYIIKVKYSNNKIKTLKLINQK